MDKKIKKSQEKPYKKRGQVHKLKTDNKSKIEEREKRIREKNKHEANSEFDIETETVIQMTNKNRIQREEQQKKKMSMKGKKIQKKKKKIKIFLGIFSFTVLIVGSIIFTLTSPIFNIKEINVSNNEQVSSETIISLSQLKPDENIFKFNESIVSKKIKENAYIEDVKIKRNIPSTVEIEVKERIPKYSVDYMGKYVYINKQGYLLEISEDSKGLPIIYGIATDEEIVIGKRLNNKDLDILEDILKIMSSATENGLENNITSIDISNKNDYIIYIEEQKKKIHLGDVSNLSNKMLYILAIMEQEKKEGEIFVNGDLNNKFQPYFREKV